MRSRIPQLIDVAIVVLLLACSVYVGVIALDRATGRPAPNSEVPEEPLSIVGAQLIGSRDARAVLVEYSDFQCPYCVGFTKTVWPRLKSTYVDTGRLRVAFVHFPLDDLHPQARAAAVAADCAAKRDRFWQLHDVLFAQPGDFSVSDLVAKGRLAGVTDPQFRGCIDAGLSDVSQLGIAAGRQAGVSGTPTFFAGWGESDGTVRVRYRLAGLRPFEDFVSVLDKLSDEQKATSGRK